MLRAFWIRASSYSGTHREISLRTAASERTSDSAHHAANVARKSTPAERAIAILSFGFGVGTVVSSSASGSS